MLLLLFGPPAVGKMTVGRAVADRSGFRLFHNHLTIEPLLEIFGHGTPPFARLNDEFRCRILQEAAAHGQDLVFTLVWDLDDPDDVAVVETYLGAYDGPVALVELRADLDTRLERNGTDERLRHKPSKRDLAWSDGNVREMERHRMTTVEGPGVAGDLFRTHPHLVLDTTDLSPAEAAEQILAWVAQLPIAELPAAGRSQERRGGRGSSTGVRAT